LFVINGYLNVFLQGGNCLLRKNAYNNSATILLNDTEKERYNELAGKYQHDCGMTRDEAEYKAYGDIKEARVGKKARFVKIGGAPITPIRWIVKGFLEVGALGMIFGDSGTYKSFLSVALSSCVATGRPFFNMPIKRKGAVYYIAAEGQTGIIRRFRAWSQENQPIQDAPLYRYEGIVSLIGAADVLIAALDEAVQSETEPPVLVIIDTWSRSLANDDSDTSAAAEGLYKLDTIRDKFPDIAVMIVHHTGHANKDRARGASLLHAAVDSEYKLALDKDRKIVMTNTKNKESQPLPPLAFKPRVVNLLDGHGKNILNGDGEVETSAVLEMVGYTEPIKGLGANQTWVVDTLKRQDDNRLHYSDLLTAYKTDLGHRKTQFDQTLDGLISNNIIIKDNGYILLT